MDLLNLTEVHHGNRLANSAGSRSPRKKGCISTFRPLSCSTLIAAGLAALTASASHVDQTLVLKPGWNAIYLEVTPDDGNEATTDDTLCENVFNAGEYGAVTTVMAYRSDAYDETRQYGDDGSEILQKPVSYLTWLRGDATGSTLRALAGGRSYLIYVTGKSQVTNKVTGVPCAPLMTWRDTSNGDFINLVGMTLSIEDKIPASKCFGEGPYGNKGTIYEVGGTNSVPDFKPVAFMGVPKIVSGKAYGASAERSGSWGGVIGFVSSGGITFGADDSQASVEVKNNGTSERIFRFTTVASILPGENFPEQFQRRLPRTDLVSDAAWTNLASGSSWDVKLEPGKSVVETFSVDRLKLSENAAYGAVLVIDDLSGTQMRVRVPIFVEKGAESAEAVEFPVGLWSGYIQMEAVSRLDDTNRIPVKAGGTLKMNVMMHVAQDGSVKLLQRVVAGVETNGTQRLWRELESVPAEVTNARRFSTVMMSIDNPVVEKTSGTFGDSLAFDWTVAERAADNPFRHAWHPDHDGKKADYSGAAPSGDDLANYANVVKPELWSITNRMEFSWHENNDPYKDVNFERTPTEKTAGFVTWTVDGLTAKEPIRSIGVFVLQRAIKAATIED